ncbi:hypothetical protein GCM10029978_112170 [Actinoallomurus acanthiterrae]
MHVTEYTRAEVILDHRRLGRTPENEDRINLGFLPDEISRGSLTVRDNDREVKTHPLRRHPVDGHYGMKARHGIEELRQSEGMERIRAYDFDCDHLRFPILAHRSTRNTLLAPDLNVAIEDHHGKRSLDQEQTPVARGMLLSIREGVCTDTNR